MRAFYKFCFMFSRRFMKREHKLVVTYQKVFGSMMKCWKEEIVVLKTLLISAGAIKCGNSRAQMHYHSVNQSPLISCDDLGMSPLTTPIKRGGNVSG